MMKSKKMKTGLNKKNRSHKLQITVLRDWLGFFLSLAGFLLSLSGTDVFSVANFKIECTGVILKETYKDEKTKSDNWDHISTLQLGECCRIEDVLVEIVGQGIRQKCTFIWEYLEISKCWTELETFSGTVRTHRFTFVWREYSRNAAKVQWRRTLHSCYFKKVP